MMQVVSLCASSIGTFKFSCNWLSPSMSLTLIRAIRSHLSCNILCIFGLDGNMFCPSSLLPFHYLLRESERYVVYGGGKEGRELLQECLLITEKYRRKEHPSYGNNQMDHAVSYLHSKNFVEAKRLLKTCLEIMVKTVEPDDQSITFPMMHRAVTLYHLKQEEEAKELALEALRIREKSFGKDSLPGGEVPDGLVSSQTRMGKDDKEILTRLFRLPKHSRERVGN